MKIEKFEVTWFHDMPPSAGSGSLFFSCNIDICSFVKNSGGSCGLLLASPGAYDLSIAKNKSCVVAISCECQAFFAKQLTSELNKYGALEIEVMRFPPGLINNGNYERDSA